MMQLHSAAMAPPRRLPTAHGSAVVPPGHDAPGFQRPGRSCVAPRAAVDRPDASEPSKSVQPEEVQQPSTGTAAARQDQGQQDEAPAGASSSGPVQADGDGSDGIEVGANIVSSLRHAANDAACCCCWKVCHTRKHTAQTAAAVACQMLKLSACHALVARRLG